MQLTVNPKRVYGKRDVMIYGHFIEHFHRQIYGGVYEPGHRLSDEEGFRQDVLEAMKKIKIPVLRWPGGCFVSAYHWKKAVGLNRTPMFDKAWRVEDPNSFGTDEYIRLCRKIGCAPYICTNAGTGGAEEMSDWVEYCNLEREGMFARQRVENGYKDPHHVKFWSIGNENYGDWELGAKPAGEWGRLVKEAAKLMLHVDPSIELSAAAIPDLDWNIHLLKNCANRLKWISLHQYWNLMPEENDFATYEQVLAYTPSIADSIDRVRGLLTAMGLQDRIKIAFDEWNLRGWHHPNVHSVRQGIHKKDYLDPRDKNDNNADYTMADAVFTACFLNSCNRNCDIVGMANFAPVVNTRGCIFTHEDGIVLRSTYHVFDLFVNVLGDTILDLWQDEAITLDAAHKEGGKVKVETLDLLATAREDGAIVLSAVNKHPHDAVSISALNGTGKEKWRLHTVNGNSTEAYNDIGQSGVVSTVSGWHSMAGGIDLPPHSVNMIECV